MAHPIAAFAFPATEGAIYGLTNCRPFLFSATEGAACGATKNRSLYFWLPRAQLWRNQKQVVLLSATEEASFGATDSRPSYIRQPRAQPMAQLIAAWQPRAQPMVQPSTGRSLFGNRVRGLCRNQ